MIEGDRRRFRIVIVGAGFSGIGMAIRLRQRGIDDFVLLERADDVGGVWELTTYPGCRCDVASHLYSFSFAPNPEWSHTFSAQPEIRDYLRRCADAYGIRGHVRTGVTVGEARWRENEQDWELETSDGAYTAQLVVNARGPLTEPLLPDVPGLDTFAGTVMHSAQWDHSHDLTGERVASVGTGSSAIQYVPEIAPIAAQLTVFQRTAPWVIPHSDRPISDRQRALFRRIPLAQKAVRAGVYASRELLVLGFVKQPAGMALLERVATAHLRKQVSDPALRSAVTPHFTLGCKRILPSNRWYPALQRPNVELVTSALAEVRPHSVVDARGVERQVDTIVLGTGYHVADIPYAATVFGRDGLSLRDVWGGSPRAYLGLTVPGFPNFFTMLGPNTGLGHSSMVFMAESQIAQVLRVIERMDQTGAATAEVTPAAYEAYNRDVDARMDGTVWDVGGCRSWYVDETGRNSTIWPDWTWRFRQRCRRLDPTAYRLRPAADSRPAPAMPLQRASG